MIKKRILIFQEFHDINRNISLLIILKQLKPREMQPEISAYQCIVIGAGPSGIGAAYTLHQQQLPYLVLEARLRIGGRLRCARIDGVDVDEGGGWIHSYSKNNPLFKFVNKFGIKQSPISSHRVVRRLCYDGQLGRPFSQQVLEASQYDIFQFFKTAKRNSRKYDYDISILTAAQQFLHENSSNMSDQERRCTQTLINLTQHYQASSAQHLSVNHYEYRMYEGGDFLPDGTYTNLIQTISEGLNIQLNKKVVSIDRRADNIILVKCSDQSMYCCKKIIVSVPLALMKMKAVEIIPELPPRHQKAIDNLGIGLMNKIHISFTEKFWGPSYWVTIGCNQRGKYPHFFDLSQKGRYILCCYVTDDFARKIEKYSDEKIISQILTLMRKVFGKDKVKIREAKITRWGSDEYSRGSYSSFHVGSTPDDCYELRKPIQDRMYIVGQHVYAEHIGTAHGAFQTGVWAAEDIIKKMHWINPKSRRPLNMKY